MARPTKSGKSEAADSPVFTIPEVPSTPLTKANWEASVKEIIKKYQTDTPFNLIRAFLPIGILVELNGLKTNNVVNFKIGWVEDFPKLRPVRLVSFSIEKGPGLSSVYTDFGLELFQWDSLPTVNYISGLSFIKRGERGSLIIKQTVATETKIKSVLEKFLNNASRIMVENCKLPKTITK